jgi:hypothetical protein
MNHGRLDDYRLRHDDCGLRKAADVNTAEHAGLADFYGDAHVRRMGGRREHGGSKRQRKNLFHHDFPQMNKSRRLNAPTACSADSNLNVPAGAQP